MIILGGLMTSVKQLYD